MARAFLGVLLAFGCASCVAAPDPEPDPLVAKFRARAAADEITRFERFRASADQTERADAALMVLLRLTADEIYEIGVTEGGQPDGPEWLVAWSCDPDNDEEPIFAALEGAGLPFGGGGNLGCIGFHVRRELFFEARRALLGSEDVRSRVAAGTLHVTEPRFRLG